MFQSFREKIGQLLLNSRSKSVFRDRKVFNLQQAETFGIIFDAGNKGDFELVRKYVNYLKEMKKKVMVMGYYDEKEIPTMTYSKLEYDFFSHKDLNFFRIPSGTIIENFINEEYDVLINLNLYNHFPLRYIGVTSRAKYKVGRFEPDNKETYDMLIESAPDKSFKYFLRQVDTYLAMVNAKKEETE